MIRRPPRSTRTDTLCPYTTLFRSIKADAVGAGCVEREAAVGEARDNARAVDAQRARFLDQPELHRVPIEPPEIFERVKPHRALPAAAISGEIIGEHRVREHRHMAEHVVKDVGFLQIIELIGPPDEIARSEARRVGKEGGSRCRTRWSPYHEKKKKKGKDLT